MCIGINRDLFPLCYFAEKPEILSFCLVSTNNCSEDGHEVVETDTETVTCQVSASPEALVYWSYLGSDSKNPEGPLDTFQRRMIDNHDGTLKIRNLRRNDTGYYKCYANNTEGWDHAVVHLRVKGN